jgi:hypothetical protein
VAAAAAADVGVNKPIPDELEFIRFIIILVTYVYKLSVFFGLFEMIF